MLLGPFGTTGQFRGLCIISGVILAKEQNDMIAILRAKCELEEEKA